MPRGKKYKNAHRSTYLCEEETWQVGNAFAKAIGKDFNYILTTNLLMNMITMKEQYEKDINFINQMKGGETKK